MRPYAAAALSNPFAGRPFVQATVNDVHSRLNTTRVAHVAAPRTVTELQEIVAGAARGGYRISIAGGRHATGGQQFGTGTLLLDMRDLARVVDFDPEAGRVTVEGGIDWVRLIHHLLWAGAGDPQPWSIIQKQSGADRLTIGGALSSNIHGRGLTLSPFVADVESLELVCPGGHLLTCSRSANPGLFALAVGGYGLFGVAARVTLRLARRRKLERRVAIVRADDLPRLFDERIAQGFVFGDFQFATDSRSREFLQVGVLSCYRPIALDAQVPPDQRVLETRDWRRLLLLAHTDKSRAFAEYARYYMSTDGQVYWSDTHQLSEYIDGYHEAIDCQLGAATPGSEAITELYVPRAVLPAFMSAVREDARQYAMNVIYGTVRLVERDDETVLAWAREPWACVVLNLHVDHSAAGIETARCHMRRLIDTAAEFGGSYYLTYHRWAARAQVERCHPRMHEFLSRKAEHDPAGVFTSDWHVHHARLMGGKER